MELGIVLIVSLCTCMQWIANPGPVYNFLWHIGHLKCFAFWCWINIFSSSKSRLQYLHYRQGLVAFLQFRKRIILHLSFEMTLSKLELNYNISRPLIAILYKRSLRHLSHVWGMILISSSWSFYPNRVGPNKCKYCPTKKTILTALILLHRC